MGRVGLRISLGGVCGGGYLFIVGSGEMWDWVFVSFGGEGDIFDDEVLVPCV